MFKFITHRPLWVNIIAGIVLGIALFALVLLSLDWFTHHDKSSTVPFVAGKSLDEAEKMLDKAGFEVEIQDSIYVDTMKAGTVIKQFPEGDAVVKSNRVVYLIVNRAIPPMVEMPNLVGYSFRNAEMVLKSMGLRVGDTTSKPDFAKDAVLEQSYNGQPIAPKTQIRKGSVISLVLGDGVGNREFAVPVIVGMTYCDAKQMLENSGVLLGAVVLNPDVSDTCSAYIFKQAPERFDDEKRIQKIRSGQTIDVWLQTDKPARADSAGNDLPDTPFPR